MKIRVVGAESMRTDRQTNEQTSRHEEAHRRFSQFCECANKRGRSSAVCNFRLLKFYKKNESVVNESENLIKLKCNIWEW